jgi:glycerophosphoryl diester phosphodiesterase
MLRKILIGAAILVAAVYLWNASWLAPAQIGETRLVAHRGVHQNFDRTGLTNDSCTATMIREPIVSEIENTIPAMQAAFAAGSDFVELDVHPPPTASSPSFTTGRSIAAPRARARPARTTWRI